jgi:hypothetical protein
MLLAWCRTHFITVQRHVMCSVNGTAAWGVSDVWRLRCSSVSEPPHCGVRIALSLVSRTATQHFGFWILDQVTWCVTCSPPEFDEGSCHLFCLQVLKQTGNQDLCYYNFLCAHPYGLLSDFNHVFSNIGYIMLGLLFILLTHRRDIMHRKSDARLDKVTYPMLLQYTLV